MHINKLYNFGNYSINIMSIFINEINGEDKLENSRELLLEHYVIFIYSICITFITKIKYIIIILFALPQLCLTIFI